jgi:hypothetical protein
LIDELVRLASRAHPEARRPDIGSP